MNEETVAVEPTDTAVGTATDVPFVFGLALWIPTFAVVLWVMLRLFGRTSTVEVPADDEG